MAHTPYTFTSLSAVTAAANGSIHRTRGVENLTVKINYTGTPTAVKVVLEGTADDSGDYTQIGSAMEDAPGDADADFMYYFNKVEGYVRLRLVTLTGGSSPTVTGKIVFTGGS